MNETISSSLDRAAAAIEAADAMLIGAGAGMGVDSGLPDFRGNEGFWKAYPPFRGRAFASLSTPHWFETDPELAWGFFGHRLNLYRGTSPHSGFAILRRWSERMRHGAFVFTSNVDGHFQKAGFEAERVFECHGSIGHLQCAANCTPEIWSSDELQLEITEATIRCLTELPKCPQCGGIARPNILMFDDWGWNEQRAMEQQRRYQCWLARTADCRRIVIELGAGLAIPTVRRECERGRGSLIRVNPRESETPAGGISLPMGAFESLMEIDRRFGTPEC